MKMDKDLFINNMKQQFVDADEIEIKINTEFRKIDSYDSLTGMTILVMLKDEYGVDITEVDFKAKRTVQELFDYVENCNKL